MYPTQHSTVSFYLQCCLAFGVLLWEVTAHGKSPYPDVELSQVYEKLANGYRLDRPDGCPENIYSTMLKCEKINNKHIAQYLLIL